MFATPYPLLFRDTSFSLYGKEEELFGSNGGILIGFTKCKDIWKPLLAAVETDTKDIEERNVD